MVKTFEQLSEKTNFFANSHAREMLDGSLEYDMDKLIVAAVNEHKLEEAKELIEYVLRMEDEE